MNIDDLSDRIAREMIAEGLLTQEKYEEIQVKGMDIRWILERKRLEANLPDDTTAEEHLRAVYRAAFQEARPLPKGDE